VYQLYFTYPFLVAAAYSLGALLARRKKWLGTYAEAMRSIKVQRACILSGAFFCLDVALGWRQLLQRNTLPIWYTVMLLLFGLAIFYAVSTYIFMVFISLIGRRFFLTRWFFNRPPQLAEENPSAQSDSNV
jgi:hypothetical protein